MVLVGETHGVAENADVLESLARAIGPIELGLEWPAAAGAALGEYAHGGTVDVDALRPSADGRITPQHFRVARRLVADGLLLGVVAFVPEGFRSPAGDPSQNAWERALADRLLGLRDDRRPMVAMAGSVHALVQPQPLRGPDATSVGRMFARDPAFTGRDVFYPMGWHIAGAVQTVSVAVRYGRGTYTNFGVRRFPRRRRTTNGGCVFHVARATAAAVPDEPDRFLSQLAG